MIDLRNLRPPEPRFTPELEWVLEAAFSTGRPAPYQGLDSNRIWADAQALALTARIDSRNDTTDLPPQLRSRFRKAQAQAVAGALLHELTARDVAEIAARQQTAVVILKGLALVLRESVAAGARSFADLDILVPRDRAARLVRELIDRGFTSADVEATEQHLPRLDPPRGGSLEVHFALRGICVAENQPAQFEDLSASGSLERLDDFSGSVFVPTPALMVAHILVHGFQQHLLRPRSYPLFRMIADLIDLAPHEGDWEVARATWFSAIAHSVPERSLKATRTLCARLRAGERPDADTDPDATRLFHHLLAGSLDRGYADSLRAFYLRDRLTEALRRKNLHRYLGRKLRALWSRQPTQSS